MNAQRNSLHHVPLLLALLSLALFLPGVWIMERTRAWMPTLQVALPALVLAGIALTLGWRMLGGHPTGKTYGLAMGGSLTAVFSLVFWMVMVPMLLIVALPAREADSPEPELNQSCAQMKIWVRQIKSFHLDRGRMPLALEELVEEGYAPESLLYDPRQRTRDAPSYRLIAREMPPESEWDRVPMVEGRIPHARDGTRLIVFASERCAPIPNES
jgi:competence protein ComGC